MENFNNLQENLNYVEMRTVNAAREKTLFKTPIKQNCRTKMWIFRANPLEKLVFEIIRRSDKMYLMSLLPSVMILFQISDNRTVITPNNFYSIFLYAEIRK